MQEELITFETAKLAKVKGFDEVCSYLYETEKDVVYTTHKNSGLNKHHNWYSAPTQSLLQRWLREIHNIDVVIVPERYKNGVNYLVQAQKFDLTSDPETNLNFCIEGSYWFNDNHEYPTYEDAMEKGLQEALELI